MTFKNAVASCLLQYANMRGRASRSEFWWFQLFIFAVSFVLYLASFLLPDRYYNFGPVLNLLCLWWASRPGDARANAYGPAPDEGE